MKNMPVLPSGKLVLVGGGCIAWDILRPRKPHPRDLTGMLTRISIPEIKVFENLS